MDMYFIFSQGDGHTSVCKPINTTQQGKAIIEGSTWKLRFKFDRQEQTAVDERGKMSID